MQESRDFVIAHEVAHQWWNAVVGSDSRQHPFVDEALANYSAAAHFALTRGPTATQRQLDMMMRLNYHLARLTGIEDKAVDQATNAFEGLLDYGAIVYGKGALFFWALREALGEQGLHSALKDYYNRFHLSCSDRRGAKKRSRL
jgi:aminopeptidase N